VQEGVAAQGAARGSSAVWGAAHRTCGRDGACSVQHPAAASPVVLCRLSSTCHCSSGVTCIAKFAGSTAAAAGGGRRRQQRQLLLQRFGELCIHKAASDLGWPSAAARTRKSKFPTVAPASLESINRWMVSGVISRPDQGCMCASSLPVLHHMLTSSATLSHLLPRTFLKLAQLCTAI